MAKLSTAVTALKATHWQQRLAPYLVDGESVVAFASAHHLKPTTEGVAFTNARIIGFNTAAALPDDVIAVSVYADEIESYDLTCVRLVPTLTVHTPSGPRGFGTFEKAECDFIAYFLDTLQDTGIDRAASPGIERLRSNAEFARREEAQRLADRQRVAVFGEPMSESQWQAIEANAPADEHPSLILNAGRYGQLAAYVDRLVVVKKDHASRAADALKVGIIPFSKITGIEYRCGALTGVLEVLTKSYPGTGNPDYWPTAQSTRPNNPWTQANTLHLPKPYYQQAQEHIEELRRQICGDTASAVVPQTPHFCE